jgi:hypothetical protein
MLDTLSLIGDRIIAYRPILRTLGISSTTNGTLLASQLLYLYQQAGRQPFAVTDPELSAMIGLSVDEIRKARADLVKRLGGASFFSYEVRGWERQGFYDVDADRINAITHKPSQDSHSGDQPNGKTQSGNPFGQSAESIRSTDRFHSVNGPNASGQPTESSIYKNLLEEINPEEETPLPPCADPPAAEPEPKAPKDPFAAKKLPVALIPSDLLDCQELLPEFWAGKKGRRSERVFNRVCTKLRQWSPDGRRESLEAAIASGRGDVFPPRQPALAFGNGSSRSKIEPRDQFWAKCQDLKAAGAFDL